MRFYTQQHQYYCGIDLHARKMYVCIFNNLGKIVLHKNIKTDPEIFFEIIFPFLQEIVVGVECVSAARQHVLEQVVQRTDSVR